MRVSVPLFWFLDWLLTRDGDTHQAETEHASPASCFGDHVHIELMGREPADNRNNNGMRKFKVSALNMRYY